MGFLPACEVCAIDGTVRGHARKLGVERLVTLPPVKRAQTKRGKSVCGLEKKERFEPQEVFWFCTPLAQKGRTCTAPCSRFADRCGWCNLRIIARLAMLMVCDALGLWSRRR